jgi:hypothetical protein
MVMLVLGILCLQLDYKPDQNLDLYEKYINRRFKITGVIISFFENKFSFFNLIYCVQVFSILSAILFLMIALSGYQKRIK